MGRSSAKLELAWMVSEGHRSAVLSLQLGAALVSFEPISCHHPCPKFWGPLLDFSLYPQVLQATARGPHTLHLP